MLLGASIYILVSSLYSLSKTRRRNSDIPSFSTKHNGIEWCHELSFWAEPGPIVALASFPGSGNTWLRYLLQQSTGILTGSVYKDSVLRRGGFPAESVANGSVIAVKTHEHGPNSKF